MCRYLLFLTIAISYNSVNAESALQTDWSGGPGWLGPVQEFGYMFYLNESADVEEQGIIQLQDNYAKTVINEPSSLNSWACSDIDNDGDVDLVRSNSPWPQGSIGWLQNVDGLGTSWSYNTIWASLHTFPGNICLGDIDIDGDVDVIATINYQYGGLRLGWLENGSGWEFHEIFICYSNYPNGVLLNDVDCDGDLDVVCALDDGIICWENVDVLVNPGEEWIQHVLFSSESEPGSRAFFADLNNDGYSDIIVSLAADNEILWLENPSELDSINWSSHTIDTDYKTYFYFSEDIDGDGDFDVIATSHDKNMIHWWENLDGSGISWQKETVGDLLSGGRDVFAADMDSDGDIDILGCSYYAHDIALFENSNGLGTSWIKSIVDDDFHSVNSVCAEDIDGDGNLDIVGASVSYSFSCIAWLKHSYISEGAIVSSILDTQTNYYWDCLDWNHQTPSGTSVSFQVRASDDHTAMGEWSDTLSTPGSLVGILSAGDLFVQYKAILETSNPDSTPVLEDVTITWNLVGIMGGEAIVPRLLPVTVTPNPSSGFPVVRFSIPESESVELLVFDLSGRISQVIHEVEYPAGHHTVQLENLSPGIYFCRMTTGEFFDTQCFIVIK